MRNDKRIFALGFFDGVHLGHQALLKTCRNMADSLDCEAAAITFDAHPQRLFTPNVPPLLTTVDDRCRLLRNFGMDRIHTFPVTADVMGMHWESFLEGLVQQGAAGFVCGDDFRFGHKGAGNADLLLSFCQRNCLPCAVIPEQTRDGKRISSSLIRTLVESGKMESATAFLGHAHILTGSVRHGQQLGRKLGVPTANLVIPAGVVVPKFGVYACRAKVDGTSHAAVANVGIRPTVSGSGITVEPWILDFSGNLYGKEITLEFYRFLREETKFPDLTALQRQIHLDAAETRRYFETH
jgi:riboflavin kinase/FMN adenylyltransferase